MYVLYWVQNRGSATTCLALSPSWSGSSLVICMDILSQNTIVQHNVNINQFSTITFCLLHIIGCVFFLMIFFKSQNGPHSSNLYISLMLRKMASLYMQVYTTGFQDKDIISPYQIIYIYGPITVGLL